MAQRPDYARTLFGGGFRYRSWQGAAGIAMTAAFGLATASIALYVPGLGWWRLAQLAASALTLGVAVTLSWRAVEDRRHDFSVTTAGIEVGGRLCPWSDVQQFAAYGAEDEGPVRIFCVRHGAMGRVTELATNVRVPRHEYEQLVTDLRRELADLYPRLAVGGVFPPTASW